MKLADAWATIQAARAPPLPVLNPDDPTLHRRTLHGWLKQQFIQRTSISLVRAVHFQATRFWAQRKVVVGPANGLPAGIPYPPLLPPLARDPFIPGGDENVWDEIPAG